MRTRRQEDGVELLPQLVEGDVLPDPRVVDDLDAERRDDIDVALQKVTRLPVRRDADGDHAATERERLVDGDRVPFKRQVVGGGKTGRTGTHDGDLLGLLLRRDHGGEMAVLPFVVGSAALENHDVDRLVDVFPAAGGLARVRADAPADRRKRHRLTDGGKRIAEAVVLHRLDVGRDVDVGRALVHAGGGVLLDVAEFGGEALRAADVVDEGVAEVGDRVDHRHRGTRTEGALAVGEHAPDVEDGVEVLFTAAPIEDAR